jgi:hypothetical protein
MDYEKLYKDTINRLKQMVSCGKITVEVARGICADFVPESEDERIRKELIDYFKENNAALAFRGISNECVLAWLEKQGEQKSTWSEEDEKKFSDILAILRGGENCYYNSPILIDWLKSIKDRIRPRVELTQLDKNILEAAIAFVEQNNHFNCWRGVDKRTVLSALRSLRPQSQWKPSVEQIEALDFAVDCIVWEEFCIKRKVLKGLLEQLRKL